MWKEGLGELSGGQRSLVALSLILAMLLFHPAPLYILDEVDAALDLSHTQNIGNMLATHFKKSQVSFYDFTRIYICTYHNQYCHPMETCYCETWTTALTRMDINVLFCFLQFIIVSLKDGMFNNANVLFRTKFVDGMSTVQRTEQTNRR